MVEEVTYEQILALEDNPIVGRYICEHNGKFLALRIDYKLNINKKYHSKRKYALGWVKK